MIRAKVIADSISTGGHRLTTMEVTGHRFILAEFNTHRLFSRNSASSRAIPVEKQLRRVKEDPALPEVWPCEQPGMQGGSELEGFALTTAKDLWNDVSAYTVERIEDYLDDIARYFGEEAKKANRLHKSLINRLIEPWMWHTIIVTSFDWSNFAAQRCNPQAMQEMRLLAEAMMSALDASTPTEIESGGWHLPYIDAEDTAFAWEIASDAQMDPIEVLKRVSTARCARVSYLTHDGVRDLREDLALYAKLVSADPPHWSPMEHVATPVTGMVTAMPWEYEEAIRRGVHYSGLSIDRLVTGNFAPHWKQLRQIVQEERRTTSLDANPLL